MDWNTFFFPDCYTIETAIKSKQMEMKDRTKLPFSTF